MSVHITNTPRLSPFWPDAVIWRWLISAWQIQDYWCRVGGIRLNTLQSIFIAPRLWKSNSVNIHRKGSKWGVLRVSLDCNDFIPSQSLLPVHLYLASPCNEGLGKTFWVDINYQPWGQYCREEILARLGWLVLHAISPHWRRNTHPKSFG